MDVGVGPQSRPAHLSALVGKSNIIFTGIDPLVGEQPRSFPFIQGLAEFLPFKNDLFDQVLFVTSLDHFIDPRPALAEAKRVLKPTGEICIWIGEKDKNAPKPATSPEWYTALTVPPGAEDRFHYKRFTKDDFLGYVKDVNLNISKEEVMIVDAWRKNFFYKLKQ